MRKAAGQNSSYTLLCVVLWVYYNDQVISPVDTYGKMNEDKQVSLEQCSHQDKLDNSVVPQVS